MLFKISKIVFIAGILILSTTSPVTGQNPFIKDQFTADPTARVFEGKMYVYPSHDVDCGTDWFCMKDYHVFSSDDLVNWTDHGVILHQNEVAWVDTNANAMWAPDAIEREGTYYFYFPAIADTNTGFRGRKIGVATSNTPYGPFSPEAEPMEGVDGIDPNTFIDEDGQAYLYWSGRGIWGSELNSNMLQIESEPERLDEHHPQSGLREGPFMFERNGTYYLTYPRVIENTEALVYATSDHPLGPFDYQGVFMDEHESGCWTNHHSIVHYEGQWYLFYHHNDYSPDFDKNRSIRVDSLFFNPDGSIQKVEPTFRGVGLTEATSHIQIDRYTAISDDGAHIEFLDPSSPFKGWKTMLSGDHAWVRYNSVDFGNEPPERLKVRAQSVSGGTIEIKLNSLEGPVIAEIDIPESGSWNIYETSLEIQQTAVHHLFVILKNGGPVEIDWMSFK
ncbi:family 43 glycosylhydrolase [Gracilimonas mengyeensis]|uniref:Carbohydrate binding module (Family 6) n=1 Tax=Gracilimonas mengyeensis TaxID=1302730 RepID=A0A521AYJ6_9BACT|nr:family 43 glycosylhydrolase [Gracilimonas mengyeensis]SMO39869.1 Carbohydrate binding module (family 6) [Gracilimonas mengyeensis]